MLEAKKFFHDCYFLAFMIKPIICPIIKLTGEKLLKPSLTVTHLGVNESLLAFKAEKRAVSSDTLNYSNSC